MSDGRATPYRVLDLAVIAGTVVVMVAAALMMPFMPAHESGDPIGIAAFAVTADLFYILARTLG